MARLILMGDVNLMNVTDPATPFRRVAEEFRAADMVFANLECCLYAPPGTHSFHTEGFYADPDDRRRRRCEMPRSRRSASPTM